MLIEELYEKARMLPPTPGVYLMKNASGKVIYVGKSKALCNRVGSYFAPYSHHHGKTKKMVSQVSEFEIYHTATELEALVLENKFIKQYMPRYNIKLKDSKSYPYICVTDGEYPRISIVYKRESGKNRYYGPFTSASAAKKIVDTTKRAFLIPTCTKKFPKDINKSARACLNFQIGQCCAPCIGNVSQKEYNEQVANAERMFKGDLSALMEELTAKMLEASEEMRFENAAKYRDCLTSLKKNVDKQHIVTSPDVEADIVGVYSDDLGGAFTVLFIRGGAISDKESFFFGVDEIISSNAVVAFIQRFYQLREYIPHEIWIDFAVEDSDAELISEWLTEVNKSKVRVTAPKRGEKKALASQASTNAKELTLQRRKEEERESSFLISLAEFLSLPSVPENIEAYDISNSGDENITGGMTVIENGKFAKARYKSFNIKTLEHADDYGALEETLTRRFGHLDEWQAPDLILIDGGKQHVNVARSVVDKFMCGLPVFGMVKDEYHKTRTLTDGENEISLVKRNDIYTFIYKIQEEVHRFAISRMDIRRRKTVKTSSLEKIKGVGEKKAFLLLEHFGGLEAIKKASVDDIMKVKGMDNKTALAIYNFYFTEK